MTAWIPPHIHRPTIGHPCCMSCGTLIVEDLIDTHIEWHRTTAEGFQAIGAALTVLTAKVYPSAFSTMDDEVLANLRLVLERVKAGSA